MRTHGPCVFISVARATAGLPLKATSYSHAGSLSHVASQSKEGGPCRSTSPSEASPFKPVSLFTSSAASSAQSQSQSLSLSESVSGNTRGNANANVIGNRNGKGKEKRKRMCGDNSDSDYVDTGCRVDGGGGVFGG